MDYQYTGLNQINTLDYWSLVNMLMTQITPEIRKQILVRLMEMNDQLMPNHQKIQPDLARASVLNSRKKDLTESQHPALDRLNYKGQNPVPIGIPMNANNQYGANNQYNPNPYQINSNNGIGSAPMNNFSTKNQISRKDSNNEIDLDDIINDIHSDQDNLDEKLSKIKTLHTKIITDKRRRRKEKESKNDLSIN